jgi:outer membrane lipoprotein SlyB
MIQLRHVLLAASAVVFADCQATGEQYRSDVYAANQVNQAQQVQTVELLAIQPAKIAVDNSSDQTTSQVVGGVIGGILGAVIGNAVDHHGSAGTNLGAVAGVALGAAAGGQVSGGQSFVPGVQLTFKINGRIFNSAQVGQICEYRPGPALMVSTSPTSTRIQPNNPGGCPQPQQQ